jgi:ribose 5-phosphate isomerase B
VPLPRVACGRGSRYRRALSHAASSKQAGASTERHHVPHFLGQAEESGANGLRIAVASHHAGYRYKQAIAAALRSDGHIVTDFGTSSEEAVDYPLSIRPAALAVARGDCERAVILGGSGNGEAMVANRIAGIRCAVCWDVESAEVARRHNDANVISLGQRMMTESTALAIVRTWLETPFDGGRHARRIRQIDDSGV